METIALPVSGEVAPATDGLGPATTATEVVKPRSRAAQRIARAQEAVFAALEATSSYLDADEELPEFLERLSHTIAEQVGARRVAFWRLGPRGTLVLEPNPFGFERDSVIRDVRLQLGLSGEGIVERVIFRDELDFGRGTSPQLDAVWRGCGLAQVKSSIAASWRAGERRIGAVVAYDSRRGFTANDLWVLRLVGMATGLVWQYKEAEDELGQTAVRLEEAVAARRHLLNNIAAGGDEARRRFASALHDDSLQLLTGAELQLERLRAESNGSHQTVQLDQLRNTLRKVEDSLRRLLINVSPEPLQLPHDLKQAISDRLESMRLNSGIEAHVDLRLPGRIPEAIEAIVVKNISEALTNVEKHAHATRCLVTAEESDGGYRVEVTDDGTGFVVSESVHMPGHLGLLAMRERAQLAGGWCRIESDPGAGAKVEFWLPQSL
ncbi:MAG TPA: ATP-binding protein [Candidatus Dormibacteraeota bacterium]|nr:ATP-binding protein [Candidatus Dormibacteraeota bacterium]